MFALSQMTNYPPKLMRVFDSYLQNRFIFYLQIALVLSSKVNIEESVREKRKGMQYGSG